MNGNDLLTHEEANCSRLQEEFLAIKGIEIELCNINTAEVPDSLESQDYWDFVLEDMHG